MKKIFWLFVLALALPSFVHAAVNAPRDAKGKVLSTVDWVGAIPCGIDSSTGTNVVLCGGTGRNAVYGVIISSIPSTDYLVFRDSATANTSSSIAATVIANGSDANATGASTTLFFKFPVPLKFTNGISVNASAAPASSTRGRWTILYRPLAATE